MSKLETQPENKGSAVQAPPNDENGGASIQINSHGQNEGVAVQENAEKVHEEGATRAKPKTGSGGRASRGKSKSENGEKSPRTKSKSENGVGASRAKTKRENGTTESKTTTKTKPKIKTESDRTGSILKTKRVKDCDQGGLLSKYMLAGGCNFLLIGALSFAILTYLRLPNDQLLAYVLGPLQGVSLIVSTILVYSLFPSLDFGRVWPWLWALGGVGVVLVLNVFWPSMYTDLAIPSKFLGVLSFVGGLLFLKFYFHKRGRISIRKRNMAITSMVVFFALIGSIIPMVSEFSYLLNDQLYGMLVERLPTFVLMVLWPVEYLGITGEIGISGLTGYGSWLNNEGVVSLATASLKIASNMVAYAATAFVLGWTVFGRRESSAS